MTRAAIALACAASLAAACGSKKPAPKAAAPAAPVAPAAAAPAAPAAGPEAAPAPEWVYSSVGKRDPFRSFIDELEATRGGVVTPCKTPLGRFELEQLKLVAVVTGLADPVAMVEAPSGVGYSIRRGACVGKNGGVVAAIRSGEVLVSEWAIKADG
ncbi:MAG TPA: pilus assembly protein PilP, partial [Anaeromyxobacteraceae bacterium]